VDEPLRVERTGDRELTLVGALDLASASRLEEALRPLVGTEGDIRIHLGAVPFLDSTGIKVLVSAAQQLQGRGALELTGAVGSVRGVLDFAGLVHMPNVRYG
jgi:anti-anti-sigma factor